MLQGLFTACDVSSQCPPKRYTTAPVGPCHNPAPQGECYTTTPGCQRHVEPAVEVLHDGVTGDGPLSADSPVVASALPSVARTHAWSLFLHQALGKPVRLTWTRNRSTMLSFRALGSCVHLRLHVMFAAAQPDDLQAIALYIGGRSPAANRHLDAFIAAQAPAYRPPRPKATLYKQGRYHDLRALFDALNAAYFHNSCTAQILWGRANATARRRRSIQLGCYVSEDNLIRMHPSLDQALVPSYFVSGVVFHEMLHEVFGISQTGRRRLVHPPEFLAVEQGHPDYMRCQAWQKQHLSYLLHYRA